MTDARLAALVELRSGDRARVERALTGLTRPDALIVAQVVELLAWDDLVAAARQVLEAVAPGREGLLVDALLDESTDFAIRRRIPRILGTLSSQRALNGLVGGLGDARFEVRYQCGRAIDRLLTHHEGLVVDRDRIMTVVEAELSVPLQVWKGHQLIDSEDADAAAAPTDRAERGAEHIYALLAAVLPREPLTVAFRGLRSRDRSLRSLAIEYFDRVLPPPIRVRLNLLELDDDQA